MINADNWIKRADEVLASITQWNSSEGLQFAMSMIAAFYGPDSAQMKTLREGMEGIQKGKTSVS